jgi:hypothetical protein
MTETSRSVSYSQSGTMPPEPTAWVGWVLFAGTMLILVGSFQVIAGLVALFDDGYYAVTPNHLVVHASYTTWGWTHLILGALAVIAGFGVMVGQTWARIYAIVLAFIGAIVSLGFLSASPVWATIIIAIDVLVIWALSVHGREVRAS